MDVSDSPFASAKSANLTEPANEYIRRSYLTANFGNNDETWLRQSLNQGLIVLQIEESGFSTNKTFSKNKIIHLSIYLFTAMLNGSLIPIMSYFSDNGITSDIIFFWKFAFMVPIHIPCIFIEKRILSLEFRYFFNVKCLLYLLGTSVPYLLWQFFSLRVSITADGGIH